MTFFKGHAKMCGFLVSFIDIEKSHLLRMASNKCIFSIFLFRKMKHKDIQDFF